MKNVLLSIVLFLGLVSAKGAAGDLPTAGGLTPTEIGRDIQSQTQHLLDSQKAKEQEREHFSNVVKYSVLGGVLFLLILGGLLKAKR